jgi:hypothetical protein
MEKIYCKGEFIMKDKLQKAKDYVKEHKKEILIVSGLAIIGVVAGVGLNKVSKNGSHDLTDVLNTISGQEHTKPDLGVGITEDVVRYEDNGLIELWLDNLKLSDIGKLGEGITENISDVPENAKIWALMSIQEETN